MSTEFICSIWFVITWNYETGFICVFPCLVILGNSGDCIPMPPMVCDIVEPRPLYFLLLMVCNNMDDEHITQMF